MKMIQEKTQAHDYSSQQMVQTYLQSSSQERPSAEKPQQLKMNKSTSQIFGKGRKRFDMSRKDQLK
jgi:hypothetical protein